MSRACPWSSSETRPTWRSSERSPSTRARSWPRTLMPASWKVTSSPSSSFSPTPPVSFLLPLPFLPHPLLLSLYLTPSLSLASAKTRQNIEDIFATVVRAVRQKKDPKGHSSSSDPLTLKKMKAKALMRSKKCTIL